MADVYFGEWGNLVSAVDKKIKVILKKDVSPIAERILEKHIKRDIYNSYKPKKDGWVTSDGKRCTYQRRYDLINMIKSFYPDPNALFVTSLAKASPSVVKGYSFRNRYDGSFLKLLESGNMGIWKGGFPRPAVKNTQNEIDDSSQINRAIIRGIKREIEIS